MTIPVLLALSTPISAAAVLCSALLLAPGAARGQQFDRYGGFLDIKGKRTGFFHTERIDDRWWLVTPDGHGFFGIGVSHPITSMSEGAITFAYDGSQEKWMRDGIRKMRELGFNCVWSGPYSLERIRFGNIDADLADKVYREAEIPYAIHVPLIKHQVELKPGEKRPDVFGAEYREFVRGEVAKRVAPNKDNPWVLGYYYGYGSFMREDRWINETLSYEPGSPGRERLLDVLEERYGDIAKLNTVYGTSFASFPDLRKNGSLEYPRWISAVKAGGPLPERTGSKNILADAEALLGEIVEQLHKVSHAEISKHDSNHMVLGSYVKHTTYTKGIWKRIAPYIDALGPQDLSDVNPIKPSVEATGVPAMLSDQEFGNVYPLALQGKTGAPGAVPDHVDRRVLYDLLAVRIARDPDFIGVSYCAVLYDQSHWRRAYDRGQPGFFNIDGEPNRSLVETVRNANQQMLDSVREPLDETSIGELHDSYYETKAAYRLIMEQRLELLKKGKDK
ncbi:MAG: hypothetical protein OXJ37_08050 [Bryobacterales bacterium]|nr:hypothetical protein [Bryobacterales bacterium]